MKSENHTPTVIPTLKIFWRFTKPYPFLFWYGTIGSMIATIADHVLPQLIIALAFNRLQELYAANQTITVHSILPYFIAFSITAAADHGPLADPSHVGMALRDQGHEENYGTYFQHLEYMDSKFHSDRFGGALVSQVNQIRAVIRATDGYLQLEYRHMA